MKGWIEDLHAAEQDGELPQFTIMSLGENHTRGTTPGAFTPEACVASNDLGLARDRRSRHAQQVLEARWRSSSSRTTPRTARTTWTRIGRSGFVISPYCKRGFVDSTLYTTASMIRTMELILGLPPMTQYDAGATPMFNCFTNVAWLRPSHRSLPR